MSSQGTTLNTKNVFQSNHTDRLDETSQVFFFLIDPSYQIVHRVNLNYSNWFKSFFILENPADCIVS